MMKPRVKMDPDLEARAESLRVAWWVCFVIDMLLLGALVIFTVTKDQYPPSLIPWISVVVVVVGVAFVGLAMVVMGPLRELRDAVREEHQARVLMGTPEWADPEKLYSYHARRVSQELRDGWKQDAEALREDARRMMADARAMLGKR
jgi:hypothetical protein